MMIRKRLAGEVQYNDGQFIEIQTVGTEGIEKSLLIETIQVDRSETTDTPEQFQRRFPIGMWLEICTTMELRSHHAPDAELCTAPGLLMTDKRHGVPLWFVRPDCHCFRRPIS